MSLSDPISDFHDQQAAEGITAGFKDFSSLALKDLIVGVYVGRRPTSSNCSS